MSIERVERDAALVSVWLKIEGLEGPGESVRFRPTLLFPTSGYGVSPVRFDVSDDEPRMAKLYFPNHDGDSFRLSIPSVTFDAHARPGVAPTGESSMTLKGPWDLGFVAPAAADPVRYEIISAEAAPRGFHLEVTEAFGASSAFIVRGQISGAAHAGTGKVSVDGVMLVPGSFFGPKVPGTWPENRDMKFELMFPPQSADSIVITAWIVVHVAQAEVDKDQKLLELAKVTPVTVTLQALR